jgi:hypothetical protein
MTVRLRVNDLKHRSLASTASSYKSSTELLHLVRLRGPQKGYGSQPFCYLARKT